MKTINVDLLIIGDVVADRSVTWFGDGDMTAAGNKLDIDPLDVPEVVKIYGRRYNLSAAIVLDARKSAIHVDTVFCHNSKSLFATGHITTLGYSDNKNE